MEQILNFVDTSYCTCEEHRKWQRCHNGMNSDQANVIREKVLKSVRESKAKAIYKSWQSPYEWPFVTNQSRDKNIRIERLIDNLIFLYQDVEEINIQSKLWKIVDELEKLGVFFHESYTTNTLI